MANADGEDAHVGAVANMIVDAVTAYGDSVVASHNSWGEVTIEMPDGRVFQATIEELHFQT